MQTFEVRITYEVMDTRFVEAHDQTEAERLALELTNVVEDNFFTRLHKVVYSRETSPVQARSEE
jgi:hypothetical protein